MDETGEPDYATLRETLVREGLLSRGIDDKRVLSAFWRVPRHRFVDGTKRREAYEDRPLDIGKNQVITQPSLVAQMTLAAGVRPGDRVLEVGTGSGYQAAILAQLGDHVYTVERFEEFAETARKRFRSLEYENITAVVGDGSKGLQQEAPFDVIVVTAAAESPPDPLVNQLRTGGRMVIPEGSRSSQTVYGYRNTPTGKLERSRVVEARFVPLIGEHGWSQEPS